MTERPIHDFWLGMKSFNATDVAVLFTLVGLQEVSRDGVLSPVIEVGGLVRLDGVTQEECAASVGRLIKIGELVKVGDMLTNGYSLTRFSELRDSMTEFGKRRYFRLAAQKSREKQEPS
jgi:hypothetical protein